MKVLKSLISAAALICWAVAILGTDTSIVYGLLIFPGALLMWLSGGCYGSFYEQGKHYRKEIKKK